jgi:plastocyanin domain-containing protein
MALPRTIAILALGFFASMACGKRADDANAAPPPVAAGARAVAVTVDDKGFTPSSVDVKKGEKTQLVFTRTTDDTCAKAVVFPDLKVTKDLPLNKPVAIDIPTDTPRTLTFQCGMAMFKSKVVIQ